MKQKKVAIIGAGPGGIVSAKECLEAGDIPFVFEKNQGPGGVWNDASGKTWFKMQANLSHFHMGFSDFPFQDISGDFPLNSEVLTYLKNYVNHFELAPHIHYNSNIDHVGFDKGRPLITSNGKTVKFDKLIVSNGFFGNEKITHFENQENFKGTVTHSAAYQNADTYTGKRVLIYGGSFSAFEIAADLALHGVNVIHVFHKPVHIIPRMIEKNGKKIPYDLNSYNYPVADSADVSKQERILRREMFLQNSYGNPGDINRELFVDINATESNNAIVSDHYRPMVQSKGITPYRDRLKRFQPYGAELESGRHLIFDHAIMAHGFTSHLPPMTKSFYSATQYRPDDNFMPTIMNKAVLHPSYPNVAFVGRYRGPYLPIMEMQARYTTAVFSGKIHYPSMQEFQRGLQEEMKLRNLDPRPSFPRPNYVGLMMEYAEELGVVPKEFINQPNTPMIPADFRRNGIGAKSEIAELQRKRLLARLEL